LGLLLCSREGASDGLPPRGHTRLVFAAGWLTVVEDVLQFWRLLHLRNGVHQTGFGSATPSACTISTTGWNSRCRDGGTGNQGVELYPPASEELGRRVGDRRQGGLVAPILQAEHQLAKLAPLGLELCVTFESYPRNSLLIVCCRSST